MAYFKARVGGSGGNEPVLLWTNPSPTSSFAAQTLSIDVSNYSYLYFKVLNNTVSPYNTTFDIIEPIVKDKIQYLGTGSATTTWLGTGLNTREYKVTDDGIAFSGGYNDGSAANNVGIPLEIYGVKRVLM